MSYTIEKIKNNLIVHFYGELDHHISEKARLKIDEKYLEGNLKNIVLDLTQLSLMDSSGIGLIMGRYRNVKENRGNILIVSANTYIDRLIRMSGLLKIISTFSSVEEALESIKEVR